METTDFLNEIERERLIAFNEDVVMKEAVRKVIVEPIYAIGTLKPGKSATDRNWAYNLGGLNDFAMDDAKLGNQLKITTRALAAVEDAFNKISRFTRNDLKNKDDTNPAL